MGIHIENLPNELLIYDEGAKSVQYVAKKDLIVSGSGGAVTMTNGSDFNFSATPDQINTPSFNGVYDLVTTIHGYITDVSVSSFSGGWADYNDFATTGTPITITGGAGLTVLTNDGLGVNTNETKLPFGVPRLWDPSTNKLDFTGLSIGDVIDIRVVIDVIVASINTEVEGSISLGSGGSAFTIPWLPTTNYKATGTYTVASYVGFYIGSQDVLDNGGQIKLKSDTTCTVTVVGWYIKATKIGTV
jgi:hypothetical protein